MGADPYAPGAGAFELGVEADLERALGYAQLVAKPAPGFSLFGRAEGGLIYENLTPELRAILGLRYEWGQQ
jgi:hypothetical protein